MSGPVGEASEQAGTAGEPAAERHASWLELFFDLVVVTAVAQLSHRLRDEPGALDVALTGVAFYAVWNVWVSFTLYANVWGERVRTRAMLLGMFGIAVMAACVSGLTEDRGTVFVIAYLVSKSLAGAAFRKSASVLPAWSLAQDSAGSLLWLVSIWAEAPARYWLWGIAVVVDLAGAVGVHARPQQFLTRRARDAERHRVPLRVVSIDDAHLAERLGLFVVIVLGEAVAQGVDAAAHEEGGRALVVLSVLGFWLLVVLWRLTVGTGSALVPNRRGRAAPPAVLLPAHLLTTAGITALAAGLGSLAEAAGGGVEPWPLVLLCGGAAAFLAARCVLGVYQRAPWPWVLGTVTAGAAVCGVLAVVGERMRPAVVVLVVVLACGWQLAFEPVWRRLRGRPA